MEYLLILPHFLCEQAAAACPRAAGKRRKRTEGGSPSVATHHSAEATQGNTCTLEVIEFQRHIPLFSIRPSSAPGHRLGLITGSDCSAALRASSVRGLVALTAQRSAETVSNRRWFLSRSPRFIQFNSVFSTQTFTV